MFSPWNAQATVFTRDAFWGLIMPISVTGRVADIWRSYVTERLLWMAGLSVAFTSPWVEQYRNPHNYFVDYLAELDLYSRSNELIGELIRFDVHEAEGLQAAYLRIVERLVQAGFLDDADLRLARHWVHDLDRIGYTWPGQSTETAGMRAPKRTVVVDHREHVALERMSRAGGTKDTPNSQAESMAQGMKDTAVCVSGQLRTLNMRPDDPNFPPSLQPMTTRFTAADMHNLTVVRAFSFGLARASLTKRVQAETIQRYLYPSLGDFDVYMLISTREGEHEPRVGDLSACASLTPPPPARMFCEVIREDDVPLLNEAVWHTFY